ncbi:uncharacterized protein LOC108677113 [Hyalella azteca]|uniref:Uncharacterized protein LOC108677113 n=1 Tax=Hyalella azteca TaxID=294128 RepID=A0A8B7P6L8_HYAAZ|nr:uncharacterized protein LOC108677113 [Hyalella azteca]
MTLDFNTYKRRHFYTQLAKAVSARLVFLVIAAPDEEDLIVHVLGDKSLPARVKVAVTTPCFDRALSTKLPTTLKHLSPQQQEDLFKVLHLLHSPAHLAASRQVSRTLSSGASPVENPVGRSTSYKSTDRTKKSRSDNEEVSQSSTSTESPCCLPENDYKIIPSSPTSVTSSSLLTNRAAKGFDGESSGTIGASPTPEALISDSVFLYPSANEIDRGQSTHFSATDSAYTSNNSSEHYVKPETFLCVPLPHPDKKNVLPHHKNDDDQVVQDKGCSSTAILACFIDKVSRENAYPDSSSKSTRLTADQEFARKLDVGLANAGLDFRNDHEVDFTEADIQCVHEISRYALPLLLTTLAFESERRQRSHCQTMLGVARNLFAKLGL